MRHFADAVPAFRRAIARNSDALWPHVYLAATYALSDELAKARSESVEVRRINPECAATALLKLLPYKRAADIDLIVTGLRKAGLAD